MRRLQAAPGGNYMAGGSLTNVTESPRRPPTPPYLPTPSPPPVQPLQPRWDAAVKFLLGAEPVISIIAQEAASTDWDELSTSVRYLLSALSGQSLDAVVPNWLPEFISTLKEQVDSVSSAFTYLTGLIDNRVLLTTYYLLLTVVICELTIYYLLRGLIDNRVLLST